MLLAYHNIYQRGKERVRERDRERLKTKMVCPDDDVDDDALSLS